MPHDPEKYLFDMLDSCRFLLEFTSGRSIADYQSNRGFRSAVERELQIIGEALNRLLRLDPQLAARITDYQRIISFRHVLVHGYDSLDHELVWFVIEVKLPELEQELSGLLREAEQEDV